MVLLGLRLRGRCTGPGAGSPTGSCACSCRCAAKVALALGAMRRARGRGGARIDPVGQVRDLQEAVRPRRRAGRGRLHALAPAELDQQRPLAAVDLGGRRVGDQAGVRPRRRLVPILVDGARLAPAVRARRPLAVARDARRAGPGRLPAARARVRHRLRGRARAPAARRARTRPLVAAMAGVLAAFVRGGRHRLDVGADDRRPGGDRGARHAGRAAPPLPSRAGTGGAVRAGTARDCARACCGPRRVAVALAAIMCVAVPMLAQDRLEESQAAAAPRRRGGGDRRRRRRACRCSRGPPRRTSSSRCSRSRPGDLGQANRHIKDALERDSSDWSTWLVAARVQTKAGFIRQGRRSLRRAEALNRRSQLFEALRGRRATLQLGTR